MEGQGWVYFRTGLAVLAIFVSVVIGGASLLSLISPLHPLVWFVIIAVTFWGTWSQFIKPQMALYRLLNAQPKIVMKDFDIDTKHFKDGKYYLCPCVEVLAENASAERVHATAKWITADTRKMVVGENPGRWWIANEDLGKGVIEQQYVTLEANGMTRRFHIARKDPKTGTLAAWYRNQDGTESIQYLKNNGKYVVEITFLSSNRGALVARFLLVNRSKQNELVMESLDNGNQKRAFS